MKRISSYEDINGGIHPTKEACETADMLIDFGFAPELRKDQDFAHYLVEHRIVLFRLLAKYQPKRTRKPRKEEPKK